MTTRSTRRSLVQTPLTPLESLLLAQATWELGAGPNSWQAVAKLLSKHPLLSRPKSFFNAQSCHSMYEQLMKDAELEMSELNESPHAPMNIKLAEKHFRSRHTELRELILAEETKFKTILKEIEDIRAGLWDKKFEDKATANDISDEDLSVTTDRPERTDGALLPSDEIFDGSDLSGVTESAESPSSSSQSKDPRVPSAKIEEQPQSQDDNTSSINAPEQSLTPQGNVKSPSPLPSDVVAELVRTSQEEEMTMDVEVTASSPSVEPQPTSSNVNGPSSASEDVEMEVSDKVEVGMKKEITEITARCGDSGSSDVLIEHVDQRQEEEEEEEEVQEDRIQKEHTVAQGQQSVHSADTDNEGVAHSPKPSEPEEGPEHSERAHTPVPETVAVVADLAVIEGHSSESEEEPRGPTRRSTRRRKSSVTSGPPPPTRKRRRSQARLSESEPRTTVDSEDEDEAEMRDTPQPEDDPSSPFDGVMTRRREGKRKASFLDSIDSPSEKKRIREDSEPVDEDEPGPSSHNTRGRMTRQGMRTEEQKRFQNVIGMLHSQISQHRNGNIFHNPIKNSEAPDYHEIVKRPMDLKTIKTRVKDGLIANSLEFQRDIFLMFANSMMYNRPGSDVYAMAEDMMLESEGQIIAFRQTEGMVKRGQRP